MAKINIALDIDWLYADMEEGGVSLDEVLKDEIISSITTQLSTDIMKKAQLCTDDVVKDAKKRLDTAINDIIDTKLNSLIDGFLNRKIDIHDEWGDVTEKDVAITDLLKRRLDNYLTERVDNNGKKSSYSDTTRLDYAIKQHIDYPMQRQIECAATDIKKQLEDYMKKQLEENVGKNVVKLLNIDTFKK